MIGLATPLAFNADESWQLLTESKNGWLPSPSARHSAFRIRVMARRASSTGLAARAPPPPTDTLPAAGYGCLVSSEFVSRLGRRLSTTCRILTDGDVGMDVTGIQARATPASVGHSLRRTMTRTVTTE